LNLKPSQWAIGHELFSLATRVIGLPKVFREAIIAFFRPRKSARAGRRDVIYLLWDESQLSGNADSIENVSLALDDEVEGSPQASPAIPFGCLGKQEFQPSLPR
jgi:hypothetical protein